MRYIVELTKSAVGRRVSLGTKDFQAFSDAEAVRKAEEWVAPLLELYINEIVHLQVTRSGYSVFGKLYGKL